MLLYVYMSLYSYFWLFILYVSMYIFIENIPVFPNIFYQHFRMIGGYIEGISLV